MQFRDMHSEIEVNMTHDQTTKAILYNFGNETNGQTTRLIGNIFFALREHSFRNAHV